MQPTPVFLPGESHGQRAWQATVFRVTKSQTQLNKLTAPTVVEAEKTLETHLELVIILPDY